MKKCLECKKEQFPEEFKYNSFLAQYSDYCRTCQKDFDKWYQIKYHYNLSKEDVQAMYLEQLGKCKICLVPFEFTQVNIDHCHSSGKIRGLLCRHCNWLLGHAKDDQNILARAIEYLS